jgi:hypothetical protein
MTESEVFADLALHLDRRRSEDFTRRPEAIKIAQSQDESTGVQDGG